jgi:hypothetical protein
MYVVSLNSLPAHYKWSVAAREMNYRRLRTSKRGNAEERFFVKGTDLSVPQEPKNHPGPWGAEKAPFR